MKTLRVWKTTVRATLALLQIYKQFCLYCKHINVETQESNVAALGRVRTSEAVTFRFCFDACTIQVKMYAVTAAAAVRSISTSLRFFFGLQLNRTLTLPKTVYIVRRIICIDCHCKRCVCCVWLTGDQLMHWAVLNNSKPTFLEASFYIPCVINVEFFYIFCCPLSPRSLILCCFWFYVKIP